MITTLIFQALKGVGRLCIKDPAFWTHCFECDVNKIMQESAESLESNPSPAIEHKSPNKSATQVSTGRIRRNTKDPFPLLSEPFSPSSTDASG